jgi:hypothetical protein
MCGLAGMDGPTLEGRKIVENTGDQRRDGGDVDFVR